MLRSLALPIACAVLLGGCATGYSYRADRGDYYYGQPQTEYRYHGSPWDYGYGSPYGYYGPYRRVPGYGFYGRYGYPSGYGYGYGGSWGWPYSGHPRYVRPRPRPPVPGGGQADNDRDGAPWRNLDDLRRRRDGDDVARRIAPSMAQPRMEAPRARRDDGGSGMGRMIREARERRSESPVVREQEP